MLLKVKECSLGSLKRNLNVLLSGKEETEIDVVNQSLWELKGSCSKRLKMYVGRLVQMQYLRKMLVGWTRLLVVSWLAMVKMGRSYML